MKLRTMFKRTETTGLPLVTALFGHASLVMHLVVEKEKKPQVSETLLGGCVFTRVSAMKILKDLDYQVELLIPLAIVAHMLIYEYPRGCCTKLDSEPKHGSPMGLCLYVNV